MRATVGWNELGRGRRATGKPRQQGRWGAFALKELTVHIVQLEVMGRMRRAALDASGQHEHWHLLRCGEGDASEGVRHAWPSDDVDACHLAAARCLEDAGGRKCCRLLICDEDGSRACPLEPRIHGEILDAAQSGEWASGAVSSGPTHKTQAPGEARACARPASEPTRECRRSSGCVHRAAPRRKGPSTSYALPSTTTRSLSLQPTRPCSLRAAQPR